MVAVDEKLIRYNANSKNNNVGDCVKRSLSLAYNIDYNAVSTELNKIKKEINASKFNNIRCIVKFMENHGGYQQVDVPMKEYITEEQFCQEHNSGTYLLLTGKSNKNVNLEHMVTVSGGNIYDSWDSSNYYVKRYYIPNDTSVSSDITHTEFSSEDYEHFCNYIEECIKERSEFYANKYGKEWDFENIKFIIDCDDTWVHNNNVKASLTAVYYGDLLYLTDRKMNDKYAFQWEIPYVFNIRFSEDQIKDQIKKVSDNYVKHCCWKIIDAEKEAIEHQDSYKRHSKTGGRTFPYFRDGLERRVFNALPLWARNLYYDLDSYGYDIQDKWYQFYMKPLANDENPKHDKYVRFEGGNARDIIRQLNDYKKDPTNYDDEY